MLDEEKTKETKTKQIEQQIKTIEAQISQKSQSSASSAASGVEASAKPANNALAAASPQEMLPQQRIAKVDLIFEYKR
ncbi:hypothetical protein [Paenibacillus etheri]|uniref:Uncharacterized protein n=1 Tax=Paenibacillus etheri TaxID=1306852 RepID=A0A0W1ARS3_9BACL|nr:hypothetical protein [Paenibacillus etheri]KTD83982.1 hypothetical protein UQ64_27850 [Paenibacillus etheri]